MSYRRSSAGLAYLFEWQVTLTVDDVFGWLQDLRRARTEAQAPIVAIAVFPRDAVLPATNVREPLATSLPTLMACCEALFVAIEDSNERCFDAFRSLFLAPNVLSTLRKRPLVFHTRYEAIYAAQRVRPHDVLELQRLALRSSESPPLRGGR